jgi:hypothetical protein
MKSRLANPSIWSRQTTTQTRVLAPQVHNVYGVSSGHTTNHTRVPYKKVHNSWSDRWIKLKFLHEIAEAIFLSVDKISLLDADGVSSGQTTDQTRVSGQKVHNSWSGRWIVLKFLQEFPKTLVLSVAMKSLLDAANVLSGQTTDQTRVLAQQVLNSWSDRWIMLKFLQKFPEVVFLGVATQLLLDTLNVWSGHTKDQTRVPAQRSITLDPTVGSCSNVYKSFKRLVSLTSQWNRHETLLVSGRARPPTRPEYRHKRSITFYPSIGSCLIFYRSFQRLFSLAS